MHTNSKSRLARLARLMIVGFLTALLALQTPLADAQRGRGSFGGGRSFGGGGSSFGGSRSFGSGGSFGNRSGGSSFGSGSTRSFGGATGSMGTRSSGGSFGRSGSFGSGGGITRSSSMNRWSPGSSTYVYRGSSYPIYGGGAGLGFLAGYSLGYWSSPAWYYWTPFHPAFYVRPPYVSGGMVYPGGFNWLNFFLGLLVFGFLIWLFARIFFGGGRRVRYTTY
jgi:hypothetical protein